MKLFTPTSVTEIEYNMQPNQEPKCNVIFDRIYTTDDIFYSYQTGNFTCIYQKGNRCAMIVYCVEANTILYQPMKGKYETEIVTS